MHFNCRAIKLLLQSFSSAQCHTRSYQVYCQRRYFLIYKNCKPFSTRRRSMEERDLIPTKANVTDEQVIDLLKKHYNFEAVQLNPLNSFDDRNFFFKASNAVPDKSSHGYVLKILNSKDSANSNLIDGMNKMMVHLNSNVIPTPTPVLNLEGKDKFLLKLPPLVTEEFEYDDLKEVPYMVVVLRYIPGTLLSHVPWEEHTGFNSGLMAAKITEGLSNFSNSGIASNTKIWSLLGILKLQPYLNAVMDDKKLEFFKKAIESFERRVMNQVHNLTPGFVHGDLNEQNILVAKNSDGKYEWSGLLDFGDSHKSNKVFDLAVMLTYLMLDCKTLPPIDVGGHILAGYLSRLQLSETEFNVLLPCIKGRLTQSLVIGNYTYQCHPENEYILIAAENGWKLLQILESMKEEDVIQRWKEIISQYNIPMPNYL